MENDREDLSFTTLGNTGGANETPFITVQHGGHVSEEVFKSVDVHFVKCIWSFFRIADLPKTMMTIMMAKESKLVNYANKIDFYRLQM